MTQQVKERVYWDVLSHGGRDYYMAVTDQGVVEITLGLHSVEDLARSIDKRVKQNELIHSVEEVAAYKQQLVEYFAGERQVFDMPLDLRGTEFQRKVWDAIYQVPFGATCSYKDIAKAVGDEKSVRAVGTATGKNPVPIVVPCHRVITSGGTLGGFGGGLPLKIELLKLEGVMIV
ncbi:MAG: methylated-DNA--[protein]-cysteine S-methyltransferase [Tumebacillaceae bacterium]